MAEARACFPDFDVTRSWDIDFPPVADADADEDLETYLRRIGFSEAQLDYTQRGFAGAAAGAMRELSARASLIEMTDKSAGEGDFRIVEGYLRLHEHLARGLDIRLNTVVESVKWGEGGVELTTTDGETFAAERVLITLPLGVLQAGHVRFEPALPPEKWGAIEALRMGPAIKLVYIFEQPILPPEIGAFYSALNPCMWWSPSLGREHVPTVWTAFVSADRARELLAMGEAAALEQGIRVLQQELNRPDLRPVAARWINWVEDPFTLGGYSITPPGKSDAHDELARPVGDKLFWAGEAAAGIAWKATVHGAYASGRRAAAEILAIR